MSQLSLAVELAGLKLRNPTMNAAGILGMSRHQLKRLYEGGAGAVVTKSLGRNPRNGHSNPTIVSVEVGFLNSMGLPNPGVDYFRDEIKKLKAENIPVVASFFAASIEDFTYMAKVLTEAGVDALEINCSCPNVGREKCMLEADPESLEMVTKAVREASNLPIFIKLTPNVANIVEGAEIAEENGADGITAVNTLKALAVDINARKPILSNIIGGLSGPALKPVAQRCVWELFESVNIPIIGCGGISNWRDAVEFLLCGASAIQIGTALMDHGCKLFMEVVEGIERYLEENGFREVNDIVGLAHEM